MTNAVVMGPLRATPSSAAGCRALARYVRHFASRPVSSRTGYVQQGTSPSCVWQVDVGTIALDGAAACPLADSSARRPPGTSEPIVSQIKYVLTGHTEPEYTCAKKCAALGFGIADYCVHERRANGGAAGTSTYVGRSGRRISDFSGLGHD
ncbi:hypothetical protein OH76DRAFT_472370 [Lentinus brumalis]|uniref:Uncharacterized protein n=1 Tax=Lentinus brumalis TaxID=2498619 RepID=A0A371DCW8_9APHY|nr:hypothetical protein OH76DRAFT_472370 [Polyporus brumalis]